MLPRRPLFRPLCRLSTAAATLRPSIPVWRTARSYSQQHPPDAPPASATPADPAIPDAAAREKVAATLQAATSQENARRTWVPPKSPIQHRIHRHIQANGPLSVAQFMKYALLHPSEGYYARAGAPVFGRAGDFVTAPELTQLFGEMLAVWLAHQWAALGRPPAFQLVELGPGTGVLMHDVLSALAPMQDGAIFQALRAVHLVEASATMQMRQMERLTPGTAPDVDLNQFPSQWGRLDDVDVAATMAASADAGRTAGVETASPASTRTTTTTAASSPSISDDAVPEINAETEASAEAETEAEADGFPITWHQVIDTVPEGMPTLFFANEFFDALPIYKFIKTPEGWREIMVHNNVLPENTTDAPAEAFSGDDARSSTSKNSASKDLASTDLTTPENDILTFRLIQAPGHTRYSRFLPIASPRYASLPVGSVIEVSPESYAVAHHIAKRLRADLGAALFVDYGSMSVPRDTLRGIQRHRMVDLFVDGADLSADVDFGALHAATAETCAFYGPMPQGAFLRAMGVEMRLDQGLQAARDDAATAERLKATVERLTGSGASDMGDRFHVVAMTSPTVATCYPFPGPVPEAPSSA